MCVDHSSLDALMAEQLLYLPDIDAFHQEVRSKAVSESMDSRMLHNACFFYCLPYCNLDALVADMVASDLAAPGVYRQIDRRKNILPFPFFCCPGIFPLERGWEI